MSTSNNKSDYLEDALLNHIFGTTTFAKPAGVWLGLFTTTEGEAGGGTEVSGNAYARQPITQGTGFSTPTQGTRENAGAITFPVASPSSWGTVTHGGLFDAVTGGNLLYYYALEASATIVAGAQFVVSAGQLSQTES